MGPRCLRLIICFVAGLVSIQQIIAAPQNDNFADRLPVIGPTLYATNCGATREPGEPNHAGVPGGSSLWWSWTAPETGRFAVSGGGHAFPARVAIYSGDQLGTLTPIVAQAGSAPQKPAQTTFNATAGTTYAIAVDSIGEGATLLKSVAFRNRRRDILRRRQ